MISRSDLTVSEFFELSELDDLGSKDDILIHGIKRECPLSIEQIAKSFFEEGVRIENTAVNRGGSILATAALQRKDQSLKHQISHYCFKGGIYNVIIRIPQELEGIYLGNCREEFGNAGNQNGKNAILDYFRFDCIPREFIVGISVLTDANDPVNGRRYIQNPYYYNHKTHKIVNTYNLIQKLNSKMNKDTIIRLTDDTRFSKEDFKFAEYLDDKDRIFFMKQKNNYLDEKLKKEEDTELEIS